MLTTRFCFLSVVAGVALTASLPGSAHAAPAAPATIAGWTATVGKQLEGKLRNPRPIGASNEPEGVVDIAFAVDAKGVPGDARIWRSSQNRHLDRLGLRAVGALRHLPSPPASLDPQRPLVARILFVNGDRPLDVKGQARLLARTATPAQQAAVAAPLYVLASGN